MLPLLAIHAASEFYRLERKPPVTAALLAANTLIYLRPRFLHSILPSIDQVWFNPHLILRVCISALLSSTTFHRLLLLSFLYLNVEFSGI